MCSGIDSASKIEYQCIPGSKGGRCVRLKTFHLHAPIVKKSGGLNLLDSCGPVQACNGTALRLPSLSRKMCDQLAINLLMCVKRTEVVQY